MSDSPIDPGVRWSPLKLVLMALAVCILLALAHVRAKGQTIYMQDCGPNSCRTYMGPRPEWPSARIIRMPPVEDPATLERIKKWEEFCRPRIVEGNYGVRRYLYDKPGCEYGRTE